MRMRRLFQTAASVLTGLALLLSATGPAGAQLAPGPWPMLQGGPRHAGQSQTPLLGPLFLSGAPAPADVKFWQGFDKIKMSPVVAEDGTIYVGLGFSFCAINPYPSMTTKWCTKLLADVSASAALLAFNSVYGAVTVYAGDRDNSLTAFNKDTGAKLWVYNFGREGDIWTSPAAGPNGEIYFAHTQSFDGYGTFTALNPDGTVKWKYTIGQFVSTSGSPAIDSRGRMYLASNDGVLRCFVDSGTQASVCPGWPSPFIGNRPSAPVIGSGGEIYLGSDNGLSKINPNTGQVIASYQTIGSAGQPALGIDGTIYVGSKASKNKRLYAINPDMTFEWVFGPLFVEADISAFAIVGADGVVYAGMGNGAIYALRPDGTVVWTYQTGNAIISHAALSGDATPAAGGTAILYQGSQDWKLYGISSPRGSVAGNHAPVAQAGPATMSGTVGQPLVFDGSLSTDEDNDALSYQWAFGDGTSASGAVVNHSYWSPGLYQASLTVSDGLATSTDPVDVTIAGGGPASCSDSFNRANNPTGLGSPDGAQCPAGLQWTPVQGTLFISSNKANSAAVTGTHMSVLPAVAGASQTVDADFTSILDNNPAPRFGLVLRFQTPGNYYLISRLTGGTTALRISKVVNGVETVLKSVSIRNPVAGVPFHVKGTVTGNVLNLYLDGALKASVTDASSTFSGGSVGLLLATSSGSTRSYVADNFAASVE